MINYFKLFGIEQKYSINLEELEEKYFALQMKFHPDRNIGKSENEKILAIKNSADVNDGYKVLSNDVERASHLLQLKNIIVNKEKNNSFVPNNKILVEQMELRERAQEIHENKMDFKTLILEIKEKFDKTKTEFENDFISGLLENAAQNAVKLKYFEKILQEIDKK
jgi:molecular chaperone HscB